MFYAMLTSIVLSIFSDGVLFYHAFQVKSTQKFILTHTFLVLVTVGLGHGVCRKLYTLFGGQHAGKFKNHCSRLKRLNPNTSCGK